MQAYEKLAKRFERLNALNQALSVLYWDMASMMPEGGAGARGKQIALMRGMAHEMLVHPENGELFESAGDGASLGEWERANLEEMRRQWLHATCVPAELVEEMSLRGSECEVVWRSARRDNDFKRLQPYLERVLELTREVATIKGEAFGVSPYDALLDQYEPGGKSEKIDPIFDDLTQFLPGFLEEVLGKQGSRPEALPLEGSFSVARQRELAGELMKAWGFDFHHGRLDTSHHPFCGGYPEDVRLTTFYDETNFLKGVMGVLHETGHALYEQGLPARWSGMPVGEARGMSFHESQSLFVEMQISRSRAFAGWVAPIYRNAFGGSGPAWEAENLYRVTTRVARSLIRVDADEVTYPAHVILRYRLEKAMFAGELEIAELPEVWNQGMEELVGIVPPDDRDGCMQDIHWMDGSFGYFPTYTLGAMTAAQLYAGATRDLGELDEVIEKGEFALILQWLREKVHSRGSLLSTEELLVEATGSELDGTYFKEHLRRRYLQD